MVWGSEELLRKTGLFNAFMSSKEPLIIPTLETQMTLKQILCKFHLFSLSVEKVNSKTTIL